MSYMKQMQEQKDAKIKEMNDIVNGAKTENRAMTEEEQTKFDALEKEIEGIDKSIEMEKRAIALGVKKKGNNDNPPTAEELEERAFVDYILGAVENRAQNLEIGKNGAIIPVTIANRIITEAKNISPIFAKSVQYHVAGDLRVPLYDETSGSIRMAYAEDFAELEADAGNFTSVNLGGFLAGALALVGRRLENNGSFDVAAFVITQMARAVALFVEGEMLNGTKDKMQGALETTNVVVAAAATAITPDELIDLQSEVNQAFQKDAIWIMSKNTFKSIKKLKNGNDEYLMQKDITKGFPYTLLDKPVYISDNMPDMETGKKAILYGDMSGMSTNVREKAEVQVLREKYATQHAIGIITWLEMDSKITDKQKFVALQMA